MYRFEIALKSGAVLYFSCTSETVESVEGYLQRAFADPAYPGLFSYDGDGSARIPYSQIQAYTCTKYDTEYAKKATAFMDKASKQLEDGEDWKT